MPAWQGWSVFPLKLGSTQAIATEGSAGADCHGSGKLVPAMVGPFVWNLPKTTVCPFGIRALALELARRTMRCSDTVWACRSHDDPR